MTEITVEGLTKHFGQVRAVEGLTFDLPAGQVTGFLGPNGAGKTTALRMMLGLIRPTAGQALIGGRRYEELPQPRRVVGALLEATGFHPGRRGRDHLRILASGAGVSTNRVAQVLDEVHLSEDADRRIRGYSLGMRQRLGLAGALLGDPEVLVLDEPANGLDPAGMAWLRRLLRGLTAEGRTIVVSSHVLSEIAQTVDQVVIVHQGQLRFAGPIEALGAPAVSVRTPDTEQLRTALVGLGYQVDVAADSTLQVWGATAADVGRVAAQQGSTLASLSNTGTSLETAFLRLTGGDTPALTDAATPAETH